MTVGLGVTSAHGGPGLRVALVGYGLAGRVFHAPLIAHTTGMSLVAVVTGDPERQRQVSLALPGCRVVPTTDELWRVAGEIDLVVVATPTGSHVPVGLQALRSGLHVVIDKPVAGTAVDAVVLAEEAKKVGRQVHVFHNRRWDSDFLTLRSLMESGTLGRPVAMESRMESLNQLHPTSWRNSTKPRDFGGALLDLGSHLVDQAIQLMGPVASVSARTHSVRPRAGANDHFTMLLVHEGGSTSLLVGTKAAPSTGTRFTVVGTHAAARVEWIDSQERALRDGMSPAGGAWGEEPPSAVVRLCSLDAAGDRHERLLPAARGGWNGFYSKVRDAINGGQPSPAPIQHAIETLRVLDAGRTSAAENVTVVLAPPAGHGSVRGS